MLLIHHFRQGRRFTAQLLLLWLFLSGSLFCPAYATLSSGAPAALQETQPAPPCHDMAIDEPLAEASCCDNASSLCCGRSGQGVTTVADIDFSQALAAYTVGLAFDLWQVRTVLPRWTEDIYLHRSDPPVYLLNCTFLD